MKKLVISAFFAITLSSSALAAKHVPVAAAPTATATSTIPARTVNAVTPTPAPAPHSNAAPVPSNSSRLYIGAQLSDTSAGALLGYQINKMFAMEVSYDFVNPVNTTTTLLERSRYGASGIALFPIKFIEFWETSLYMKLGYGHSTEKLTVYSLPASTSVTTTNKNSITGGVGMHVDLNKSISSRLGINVVDSDRTIYLSLMYRL